RRLRDERMRAMEQPGDRAGDRVAVARPEEDVRLERAPCVGEVDPRVAATVGQLAGVHRAGIAVVAIHRPAGLADASLAAWGPAPDVAAAARRAVGNGRVDAGPAAVARVRRARVAVVAIDACMVAALNGVAGVDGAGIAVVAAAAPDRRARAVAATAAGNVV